MFLDWNNHCFSSCYNHTFGYNNHGRYVTTNKLVVTTQVWSLSCQFQGYFKVNIFIWVHMLRCHEQHCHFIIISRLSLILKKGMVYKVSLGCQASMRFLSKCTLCTWERCIASSQSSLALDKDVLSIASYTTSSEETQSII